MSKLSIITILIGFLSSTVLLKAENLYDLFATGQKEEAIHVLKNIVKTESKGKNIPFWLPLSIPSPAGL